MEKIPPTLTADLDLCGDKDEDDKSRSVAIPTTTFKGISMVLCGPSDLIDTLHYTPINAQSFLCSNGAHERLFIGHWVW